MSQEENKSSLIVKEGYLACGCYVTEFANGKKMVSPCFSCGMTDVANCLARAGQALMAVAARARQEQADATLDAAAKAVASRSVITG